ncbi:MAG TPA: winged helix-turn-helix domain-containing protein [Candidatus Binataceae bacterium]|nr:winged helix-turn-helix domain-containing protein [Candidatus Binataceae bacterium]
MAKRSDAAVPLNPGWTFISNHGHVLLCLAAEPTMILREVAARVGITERAVQRIVAELEAAGYLTRERHGRRNSYRINSRLHLRHQVESHCTVGDLIDFVLGKVPAHASASSPSANNSGGNRRPLIHDSPRQA